MTKSKRVTKARRKIRAGTGRSTAGRSVKAGTKAKPGKKKIGPASLGVKVETEESKARYESIERVLKMYRPVKKPVTMRVDADVLDWFKRDGRRYQTRINQALRRVMAEEMQKIG